jgi:hypothetical protein
MPREFSSAGPPNPRQLRRRARHFPPLMPAPAGIRRVPAPRRKRRCAATSPRV